MRFCNITFYCNPFRDVSKDCVITFKSLPVFNKKFVTRIQLSFEPFFLLHFFKFCEPNLRSPFYLHLNFNDFFFLEKQRF